MYPPQSPTRITNISILKLPGAFHCVKTSRIRFCAFSYSIGEPCGRSVQVSMYFIDVELLLFWVKYCHLSRIVLMFALRQKDVKKSALLWATVRPTSCG